MSLLPKLNLPQDLKNLSTAELEELAAEIRTKIVDVVSKNGGHLSSSLGVIELTLALHAVLDSPQDKILWDVSHQAYAHKILTGRLERFDTLRQYQGISGFTNKDESPHDVFTVGHASTALSSAFGMAKARDLKGEKYSIAVVMGDSAMSGGLSLEAINNLVHLDLKGNLIVILNDNEMSISKTVGTLSKYLTKIRMSPAYNKIKDRVEGIINRIPRIGVPLARKVERDIDRFRNYLMDLKAGVIFEEMGFKYLGPLDGYNIPLLMNAIQFAKGVKGAVIIHVSTKKGKGYEPAEKDPTQFHGTSPFDIETGKSISKSGIKSYTDVFGEAMLKLAEKDNNIVAITAAMVDGTGLEEYAKIYPQRFFDVGICEEHAVTFSAGLSVSGFRPVVAIYSTFLQRAYDQIIHDVALQNLPVTFALDRAGIVGEDGATHNGILDIAYLRSIPNMVVCAPKDENELQHLLYTAVNHNGPVAIRYPRGNGYGVPLDKEFKKVEIGKADVIFSASHVPRPTSHVIIIAIGSMVYPSMEAAKLLEKEGIGATVVNARFVKPLDKDLILKCVKDVELVVTVEEGVLQGGFGSAVMELLEENNISNVRVKRIGLPDEFIEHGPQGLIRDKYGLSAAGIADRVKQELEL